MKTFLLLVLALLGSLVFVTATLTEEEEDASPELDWLTFSDEEVPEDVSKPEVEFSSFSSDEEASQEEEEEEDELLESSPFFFDEEEEENDAEKDARDRELRGYYGAGVVGVRGGRGARFYGRTGVVGLRGVGVRGVGVRGNGVTGYRGGVVATRGGRGFVVARGRGGGVVAVGRNGYYNGGVRGFNNNRYFVNGGVRGFNNNRYYVNGGGVRGFNRGGVYYVNGGGVRGFNRGGGIFTTHGGGVFGGGNVCNFIGEFCTATYQCCGGNCVLNQCI